MAHRINYLRWLLAIAFLALATLGVVLYCAVSTALDAEQTLQSYHIVLEATRNYVTQHDDQWPKNWDDLLSAAQRAEDWPTTEEINKRVTVDFSADPAQIISQDPTNFTAITQREPNYGPYEDWIKSIQDAMRTALSK